MYVLRWGIGRTLWLIWLVLVVAITAGLYVSQIRAAGPQVFLVAAVAVPLLPFALWIWHRARTRWPRADVVIVAPAAAVFIAYAPLATAVVVLFTCSAIALGRFLLERLGVSKLLPVALSALTGFAAFSYVLFCIGLAGGYYAPVFAAMLAVPLIAFHRALGRDLRRARAALLEWRTDPHSQSAFVSVLLFFGGCFALLTAVCAVTPTIVHDSLMFHLALVKTYAATHSLTPPAAIPYGYFPQGGEVLMLVAYALGGQTAAQFIEPVFFLLALAVCVRVAMRAGTGMAAAMVGAIYTASTPFIHWSGSVLKNDLMLAAYVLAALDCILAWFEAKRTRYLCCSAFLMAAAFGVKHVALFAAVPIALLWAYAITKLPRKVVAATAVLAVFVPLCSLWVLRTWLATGNPTYPESVSRAVTSPRSRTSYWARKLALPYTLQFEGQKHFESPSSYPLGLTLLFFLPLLVLLRRHNPSNESRSVAFFTGTYLVYWGAVIAVLRYAVPPFAVAAAALGARAEALSRITRTALMATAYTFVFSITVMVASEMRPAQIPFLLLRIDADEYLKRELPPYGAMHFLATHASSEDQVIDIDAYGVAYSHNPGRTHLLLRDPREYDPGDVISRLQTIPDARWVVLPKAANAADLTSALMSTVRARQAYTDQWFTVWHIEGR